MSRSISNVVVTFGLLQVGIKLYLSASTDKVSFNMINPKTGHRVRQVLVDEEDFDNKSKTVKKAEVVSRSAVLSGYEYEKGKYITFTDEEIANMAAERKDTLDIIEYVPVSEINPLHIERTLYTAPDKGMDKAYILLYNALKDDNKAAVGTWVSRGREHIVMIRAYENGLIMHQMFYDYEVRPFELKCKPVTVSSLELALSKLLISQFSVDKFDKSRFKDSFMERLLKAVDTKLNGGSIDEVLAEVSDASVIESLRESLLTTGVAKEVLDDMITKSGVENIVESKAKKARKKAG